MSRFFERTYKKPNSHELMWVVGFLEGEASFYLNGKKPRIVVNQKDIEPLERLQKSIGGSIYDPVKDRNYFSLQVHRKNDVIAIMKDIKPFMSKRRGEQINKCLKQF